MKMSEADVAQYSGGIAGLAGQLVRLVGELLSDVVLVVEVVERLVLVDVVLDVMHVLGGVGGHVADLVDDRRYEHGPQADRDHQQPDVDERDRQAALHVALEEVHRSGQGDGQEGGDDQPADRLAQQIDHVEHEKDAHDDEHVAGDRACWRVDFGHADPPYSGSARTFLAGAKP